MPVIGFLRSTSLAASAPMIDGFRQGLMAAGFNEGQNVAIEYRYADNQLERLPGLVAELIRLPVAVIAERPRLLSRIAGGARMGWAVLVRAADLPPSTARPSA